MSNLSHKLKIALGTLGLPGLVAALIGSAGGIGVYTFGYGQGASYLSKDPNACANCHVMREPLETWAKSSHHAVAMCNDCHLSPHPIGKWITKMDNGLFHSIAFTTGAFHEPIQIKPRNRRVTQRACVKCHEGLVHTMLPDDPTDPEETLWCASCHGDVGHRLRPRSTTHERGDDRR